MVNMASGIARGRVLSPTTTAAVEVTPQYGFYAGARYINEMHFSTRQLRFVKSTQRVDSHDS